MLWFRSYVHPCRCVAVCIALGAGLIVSSFFGESAVWQDHARPVPLMPIAVLADAEYGAYAADNFARQDCDAIESAWNRSSPHLTGHTNDDAFDDIDSILPENILELPFKPLFCAMPTPEAPILAL